MLSLKWNELDLDNGFVLRKVEHKISKWYRPNPIHKQIVPMLNEIKTHESVFPFSYHRVKNRIRDVHDKITPTQLRDFFYNQALTCGVNPVIVEWLMGHDIGIAKHYLADNIKQEYSKFEQTVKLS